VTLQSALVDDDLVRERLLALLAAFFALAAVALAGVGCMACSPIRWCGGPKRSAFA